MDNPKKTGEPDRSLVSISQEHEIQYWTKRFGCTRAQLIAAVNKVGNSVAKVQAELSKR